LAEKLSVSDRVIFTGFLKNPESILDALDIVIHTSVKPEPFGRVIVEAMSRGKPVIATAMGGPLEIIKNEKTGLLIKPGHPGLLAEKIFELYKDKLKRKALAKEGKIFALSNFNAEKQISDMERIYLNIKVR
jgi:glycosyltransferase involved in cell wall biosynthesis